MLKSQLKRKIKNLDSMIGECLALMLKAKLENDVEKLTDYKVLYYSIVDERDDLLDRLEAK